jgi:hypothetical protein
MSAQRFLCPVGTCQRACRTKATWTRHLRSVHANLDFSKFLSQNAIIDLPYASPPPTLGNRHDLGSLPTSPVTPNLNYAHAHSEYDFEMEHNVAGSDFFHSDLRSSPSHGSKVGDNKEFHPIINGRFAFHLIVPLIKSSVGKPCDKDGNPLSDSDSESTKRLASDLRSQDDWTPFENHSSFELAEFLYKDNQTSAPKIDKLLHIMSDIMVDHGAQTPFSNHKDIYETIDAIPIGGLPWQSFTFTYDGPKPTVEVPTWMEADYTIWFRDPHKLFLEMIKNPDFVDSIDYTPYRQYDEDGHRQYENFMSGDWAWKQAVRICSFQFIYHSWADISIYLGYHCRNAIEQRSNVRSYYTWQR